MPEKHMEFINPTKTIKFGVTVLKNIASDEVISSVGDKQWRGSTGRSRGEVKDGGNLPITWTTPVIFFLVELTINRENNTR